VRGLARGLPTAETVLAMPRQRLDSVGERLKRGLRANAHAHRVQFERASARHSPRALRAQIVNVRERINALGERAGRSIAVVQQRRGARLNTLMQLLNALGYHNVLQRGFALVRDAAGDPVRSAVQVAANDSLDIEFSDGRVPVVATGGAGPRRRKGTPEKGGQGSLF
jgi:exodeoxyribonuclease VII large subunit